MTHKLTEQGLKNFIIDQPLPHSFTLNDVIYKLNKHRRQHWYYYYPRTLRSILEEMVNDGTLESKIGSEKRTDGSVTETFYSKPWLY